MTKLFCTTFSAFQLQFCSAWLSYTTKLYLKFSKICVASLFEFVSKRPVSDVTLKLSSLVHLSQTVPCQPPFLPPWGQLSSDKPGLLMLTVDYSVQFCFKELKKKKGVNGRLYRKKTVKEVF